MTLKNFEAKRLAIELLADVIYDFSFHQTRFNHSPIFAAECGSMVSRIYIFIGKVSGQTEKDFEEGMAEFDEWEAIKKSVRLLFEEAKETVSQSEEEHDKKKVFVSTFQSLDFYKSTPEKPAEIEYPEEGLE